MKRSNSSIRKSGTRRGAAAVAAIAVVLAACGGGSDAGDDASSPDGTDAAVVATDPIDPNAAPSGENVPDLATAADGEDTVDATDAVADDSTEPQNLIQQNGPITIEGTPLAPYDDGDDPAVGTPAPVVSGEDFDGSPRSIGGASGNPTMVVFLAHWCPHCNDEIPVLLDLEAAGSLPESLDVIGVSTAVSADRDNFPPSDWFVEKGWPWPTMADDDVLSAINAFGGTSFPFTVLLDADGNVLGRKAGQASAEDTLAFINGALG